MHDHHPCHRPTMIFATTIAHAIRAFASANSFIMHLATIIYLSFYLFLPCHYLYLLSCAILSPRHRPTLGWNDAIYVAIPLFFRPSLHWMMGWNHGFLMSPWPTPLGKALQRSLYPDIAAWWMSWSIISLTFACFSLVIVQYCTYKMADTKPPEANSFI